MLRSIARIAGVSPLECVSYRLDASVVRIVREGSDAPPEAQATRRGPFGVHRDLLVRLLVFGGLALAGAAIVAPVVDDIF